MKTAAQIRAEMAREELNRLRAKARDAWENAQ